MKYNNAHALGFTSHSGILKGNTSATIKDIERFLRLLERDVAFSAIFCVNDEIALGVMKALHKAGRRVPDDVH